MSFTYWDDDWRDVEYLASCRDRIRFSFLELYD